MSCTGALLNSRATAPASVQSPIESPTSQVQSPRSAQRTLDFGRWTLDFGLASDFGLVADNYFAMRDDYRRPTDLNLFDRSWLAFDI